MKTLLLLLLIPLLLSGCLSNRQWLSGKDVDLDGAEILLITPWGQQTIKAQHLRTRVNPKGTRKEPQVEIAPWPEPPLLPPGTNPPPAGDINIKVSTDRSVTIQK